jgi:hypothetical protein
MNTVEKTPAIDPQVLADRQAAFDHAFKGAPIDPETLAGSDNEPKQLPKRSVGRTGWWT